MRVRLILLIALLALPLAAIRAQDAVPGQAAAILPYVGFDLLERGEAALQTDDFEAAALDFSLFIYLNPTAAIGYYERSLAYAQLDRTQDALADLNTAITLPSPSLTFTALAHDSRARLHLSLNDLDRALADLGTSIEAVPDQPDSYFTRAIVYQETGDLEQALADWDQVLELVPDNVVSLTNRSGVLTALERYDDAIADYTRLIALQPDSDAFYAGRAALYNVQEQPELALADLNRALELNARDAGYYLQRGALYSQLDRPVDSAADFLVWIQAVRQTNDTRSITLIPGSSELFLMAQGDVFTMTFEVAADQVVSLTATSPEETPVDPLLVVLNPDGEPLTADDDSGGRFDAALSFTASVSGRYTVLLSHAGGNPNGPVRVKLELGSGS
jgi:tetratricopeptide (TPR) repeat protein